MLVALPLVAALVGVAAPAAVAKPVRSFTFTAEAGAHPVNGRSGQWTPPDAEIDVHEFEPVHDHPDPPGLVRSAQRARCPVRAPLRQRHRTGAARRDTVPRLTAAARQASTPAGPRGGF